MIPTYSRFSIAALALVSVLVRGAPAHAEQAGVLWESTSQVSMQGMPMAIPAQTSKICAAKEWTRPPDGGDPSCTTSDFNRTGSKATWSVRCTGANPMSGTGEMTFAADSYAGSLKFTGGEMPVTIKLSGKKIGGCDDPK